MTTNAERASGLRALADFIERYPKIEASYLDYDLHVWYLDANEEFTALEDAATESEIQWFRARHKLILSFGDVKASALRSEQVKAYALDRVGKTGAAQLDDPKEACRHMHTTVRQESNWWVTWCHDCEEIIKSQTLK